MGVEFGFFMICVGVILIVLLDSLILLIQQFIIVAIKILYNLVFMAVLVV